LKFTNWLIKKSNYAIMYYNVYIKDIIIPRRMEDFAEFSQQPQPD
jgi:hypothetical protein